MFGPPNDEAFSGHPLASRGLHPYGAFKIENSSWIRHLEKMNSVHPNHHPERYFKLQHVEVVSQMSQQDQHASQLNHAEKVVAVTFPPHQQSAEVLQPREQPLDFPPAFVTPEFSPVLAVPSGAITTMRCDQLDSVLLGESINHCVAVISLIANQSFRLVGHEAVLDRSLHQFLLMRRSARNPEGDRKTMAVCDCHELAPFADERSTNAIAPFFAPMKEASINVSSRPSCPRANKSSASAQRMPSSTPERCHCWKRRWQVWYGPYRAGRSCQGAPVRKIHNPPFSARRASLHRPPRRSGRCLCCSSHCTKGRMYSHCASVRSAMPFICFNFAPAASVYSGATFVR